MHATEEAISRLPKVDLHLHLDGAIRTQTILELGQKNNLSLPADDVEQLAEHVQVQPSCRSLTDFLACFEFFYPVLQYPESVERIAYELCEDLSQQGIIYAETRFAPVLLLDEGATQRDMVEAALRGLSRGCEEFDLPVRLILCAYRGTPAEKSLELVKLADEYQDQGIAGLDFAGDESRYETSEHKEALALAHECNLPLTVHAGEAGSVDNIREAVDLGADRIGHGVRLIDDPQLLQTVVEKQIPLELCLTSNLQTQAVSSIEEHPFPEFYRQGVKVTLNTDDPKISNTDLDFEYNLAARSFGFSIDQLKEISINGIDAAFVDDSMKNKLLAKVD